MNNGKFKVSGIIAAFAALAVLLTATAFVGLSIAFASERESGYYVCFSNQNYAVRNANKMIEADGKFILENVSLSSAVDFYVTDNAGSRWYGRNDKPLAVEDNGVYSYDIAFAPDGVFSEQGEWAATDCHVSYRFYSPAAYAVEIDGERTELTHNPYFISYELYYISSVRLDAQAQVCYQGEVHTVTGDGRYRVLFTPGKTVNGNLYMFDEHGNYGSGDDYVYRIAVEDAPVYYAALLDDAGESDVTIDGKGARIMSRYEKNVAAAEYRTSEFFVAERDGAVRYELYEKGANGAYTRLDDPDKVSRLTATDAGWYCLSVIDGGNTFVPSLVSAERDFGGYYAVSELNNFGYDADGNVDIADEYRFARVEEGEEDYNEDYEQYLLYIEITDGILRDGNFEFYITDGADKYKDGGEYITLSTVGKYKILFSADHDYGRARNYKYVLQDESAAGEEIEIGSAEQFTAFAERCASSADYSIGLKVYLTADIDFGGKEFVPVGAFGGTFYGGYHKLSNITYTGGAVFTSVSYTGAIERLVVENVAIGDKTVDYVGVVGKNYGTVKYVDVSGTVTGRHYAGGVVAYNGRSDTDSGNSSDLTNKATVTGCTNSADVFGETSVGGIAGHNTGEIVSCLSSGNITGAKNRSSATAENIGGIAGYSIGRIYDCANAGNVTGGDNSRYAGGIVGLCAGDMYFAINRGEVCAERYAGGIVGYYGMRDGSDTDDADAVGRINIINYTASYGNVSAQVYAGGVIGCVGGLSGSAAENRRLKVYNCASVGDVDATAGSYAGGIVGYGVNADIKSCLSQGAIRAKGLNGGAYAGGIIGYGGGVRYCMSAATVKGEDYIGGIAGFGTDGIVGCYANVLILGDAEHTGGIAGGVTKFDGATQKFDGIAGNYYIGESETSVSGGIAGTDYAGKFDYAAVRIDRDRLSSAGALSPALSEDFSREFWQGGKGAPSYPMPRNFESAEECSEFDDEKLWAALFDKYVNEFAALAEESARRTCTVTFLEWNKDNGELYDDDGILLTDNFEIILSARVFEGDTVVSPALEFAVETGGRYVYEGNKARYFVSMPDAFTANENTTVYARYREIITSVSDADGIALVEGDFCEGVTVEIVKVGEYCTLNFMLDGEPLQVEKVTVKVFAGDNAEKFRLIDGDGSIVETMPSGRFLRFEFTSGQYFRLDEKSGNLPFWAWLLIGMASVVAAGGIAWFIVFLVRRRTSKKSQMNAEQREIKD